MLIEVEMGARSEWSRKGERHIVSWVEGGIGFVRGRDGNVLF